MGYLDAPYTGLHNDPYPEPPPQRPAERGWWGGLLDETAKLPQGLKQLVVDAVTRQPRTDPTQPVVTPGPGSLLDLTPVPGVTDAYKASDDVSKGGYEGGKAVGTYLGGLLGIIPAVGAVRKAGPIRAYHGSPHNFDKFDISKIGTGEGTQAFGHGLYVAENEGVARSYRPKGVTDAGGGTLSQDAQRALEYIDPKFITNGNLEAGLADAVKRLKEQAEFYRKSYGPGENLYDSAVARLQAIDPKALKPAGHMYEVDVHADPKRIINDDLPFQRSGVPTPVIEKWRDAPTPQERTQILLDAGFQGKKYLDQGSRSTLGNLPINPITDTARLLLQGTKNDVESAVKALRGNTAFNQVERDEIEKVLRASSKAPTSNYVIFDPEIIEILRKYGMLPAAAGAAAATVPGLLNEGQTY